MGNLSDYLKYLLCGVLCVVSMILTACFALSFGSSTGLGDSQFMRIVSPALLITIGVVLDLSKYIFWGASSNDRKSVFTFLAVVLMLFSWMASVAFFVSSEDKKVTAFRKETAEYRAFQTEVDFLRSTIEQKTMQSKKRLDSKFHEQWDKGEALTNDIQALNAKLNRLIKTEPHVGLDEARSSIVSIAFFDSLSAFTGTNTTLIRNIFYGLLALLIEVCAFGLISLCGKPEEMSSRLYVEKDSNLLMETDVGIIEKSLGEDEKEFVMNGGDEDSNLNLDTTPLPCSVEREGLNSELDKECHYTSEELRLISDIKNKKVPPVFRRIKDLSYEITQIRIREILQDLKKQGVLVQGSKNSLILVHHYHSEYPVV